MIYLSAGHNSKSNNIKQDPGAVNSDGVKEGDLTIEFRDLVKEALQRLNVPFITDSDEESLAMYLKRIQTGNGSTVVEYHFDCATNPDATGTTALIGEDADRLDKAFAKELVESTAEMLHIKNRGVVSERDSHRGRLGLMREQGIVALIELGFITNRLDLVAYQQFKYQLAKKHAFILATYDNMIL